MLCLALQGIQSPIVECTLLAVRCNGLYIVKEVLVNVAVQACLHVKAAAAMCEDLCIDAALLRKTRTAGKDYTELLCSLFKQKPY